MKHNTHKLPSTFVYFHTEKITTNTITCVIDRDRAGPLCTVVTILRGMVFLTSASVVVSAIVVKWNVACPLRTGNVMTLAVQFVFPCET